MSSSSNQNLKLKRIQGIYPTVFIVLVRLQTPIEPAVSKDVDTSSVTAQSPILIIGPQETLRRRGASFESFEEETKPILQAV